MSTYIVPFDYYDEDRQALAGSEQLAGLDSVAAMQIKQGQGPLPDNDPVQPANVVKLTGAQVREGEF